MLSEDSDDLLGDFGTLTNKLAEGCLNLGTQLNLDLDPTSTSSGRQHWKKGQ